MRKEKLKREEAQKSDLSGERSRSPWSWWLGAGVLGCVLLGAGLFAHDLAIATTQQGLAGFALLGRGSQRTVRRSPPKRTQKTTVLAARVVEKPVWEGPRHVFFLSLDGFAFRHLWDKRLPLHNIRRLAKGGVWGRSTTVFPSMTWPSHASLLTGQYPRRHGILGNRWLSDGQTAILPYIDNVEKDRRAATLYDLAHQAKIPAAALMWPATQGAKTLTYNLPLLYSKKLRKRYTTPNIIRMFGALSQSLHSVHRKFRAEGPDLDKLATDLALRLIQKKKERPRMMFLHLTYLDTTQHHHSSSLEHLQKAAASVDKQVGRLIDATKKAGIHKKSLFVVASDHGFQRAKCSVDIRRLLINAGLSRYHVMNSYRATRQDVSAFLNGSSAFLYIRKNRSKKRRKQILKRLRKVLAKHKHIERVILPAEYHRLGLPTPKEHPGSPDAITLTPIHCSFGLHGKGGVVRRVWHGTHGYLPSAPSLHVPFVLSGKGILQRDEPIMARNVDLAPTVAAMMRLQWPAATDGRVLREALKPSLRPDTFELVSQSNKSEKADSASMAHSDKNKKVKAEDTDDDDTPKKSSDGSGSG